MAHHGKEVVIVRGRRRRSVHYKRSEYVAYTAKELNIMLAGINMLLGNQNERRLLELDIEEVEAVKNELVSEIEFSVK